VGQQIWFRLVLVNVVLIHCREVKATNVTGPGKLNTITKDYSLVNISHTDTVVLTNKYMLLQSATYPFPYHIPPSFPGMQTHTALTGLDYVAFPILFQR